MRFVLFLVLLLTVAPVAAARDDIMPPPHPAPRIPVESRELAGGKKYSPESKDFRSAKALAESIAHAPEYEGKGEALDGERILVDGTEVRLFGIITPALTSNYGPQTRSSLDRMLEGRHVLCKVTDRDPEGHPVAFCGTVKVPDLSYEMLRQGWAMVDRRALKGNSLASVYEKAEQEAQTQNRGIFTPTQLAMTVPINNPDKAVTSSVPVAVEPPPPAPVETAEAKRAVAPPLPRSVFEPSFVERYQILFGALLILVAAGVFSYGLVSRENKIMSDRRRALAAALRGELMSARLICRTRAKELLRQEKTDVEPGRPAQVWPRIRSLVYQAHVGQLGILGSELARQVASVYGQFSDYAAYYQSANPSARLPVSRVVAETLNTLADHVDTLLQGLTEVEGTGRALLGEDIMAEEEARAAAENVRLATAAAAKRALPSPPPSTAVPNTEALLRQRAAVKQQQASRPSHAPVFPPPPTRKAQRNPFDAEDDEGDGAEDKASSHVA